MSSHLNCDNDGFPPVGMASAKPGFLLGESGWYGALGIPASLPHEAEAPESWIGWRRQRLKPAITGFLFPSAWSIFFLFAGSIPIFLEAIGSGIGMSNQLAFGLWLAAFGLLWLGASEFSFAEAYTVTIGAAGINAPGCLGALVFKFDCFTPDKSLA